MYDEKKLQFQMKYQQLADLYNQIENEIHGFDLCENEKKDRIEIQNVIRCLLSFLLEQQFYESKEKGIESCFHYLLRNYHMEETTAKVVSQLIFECDRDSKNTLLCVLQKFAKNNHDEEGY